MLHNRIYHFRKYNQVEPETLAKLIGIDVDEYLKYESGESTPDIDTLQILAQAYKVTIPEIYGDNPILTLTTDTDNKTEEELKADVIKFSELDTFEKALILAYRTSENKEKFFTVL